MISFFKSFKSKPQPQNSIPGMESFLKSLEGVNFAHQKSTLTDFDSIPKEDSDRLIVDQKLKGEEPFTDYRESKAFGCFIGLVIGDALGIFTQNLPLDFQRKDLKGFENVGDLKDQSFLQKNKPGQYTAATSMSLCIADSILDNDFAYNGKDLRYRTLLWYYTGYNNGKNAEKEEFARCSGSIGQSTYNACLEFKTNPTDRVNSYGKQNNDNGNGTIIRLAAIPIAFLDDLNRCVDYAAEQSYTSHNGTEAAECCRLLSFILWHFLNIEAKDECKAFMGSLKSSFKSECKAVQCLAESLQESEEDLKLYNPKFNKTIADRNWNWQDPEYKYSPHRGSKSSAGIYCMDTLAMALNIVYYSESFKDAVLRAVNLGGDSVALGATVGMLAGALYGYGSDMKDWYLNYVAKWDEKKCAMRAYKLSTGWTTTKGSNKVFTRR